MIEMKDMQREGREMEEIDHEDQDSAEMISEIS